MDSLEEGKRLRATMGDIVFTAGDDDFIMIKERQMMGPAHTVVLTREEAIFVRDQITAALDAGLVAS